MHVEYLRVEPPGIPTAFWRSVGPSHNVFVTESFMDELAAAAKQDPVTYRRALLDKAPRNATVTAVTPMELMVLGQREFAAMIDEVPGFAHKLLSGLAHRLREYDVKTLG